MEGNAFQEIADALDRQTFQEIADDLRLNGAGTGKIAVPFTSWASEFLAQNRDPAELSDRQCAERGRGMIFLLTGRLLTYGGSAS